VRDGPHSCLIKGLKVHCAGLVFLSLVSGCGDSSVPQVAPAPAPASSTDARYGAPEVKSPRNLRSRSADPCTSLSPQQLEGLGYSFPGSFRLAIARFRSVHGRGDSHDEPLRASVVVTRDLFVDTYRIHLLPIFHPLEIAGLPAVEQQSPVGRGICTTTVGVADSQTLEVDVSIDDLAEDGGPTSDPCGEGRQVIEAIVSTLPPL